MPAPDTRWTYSTGRVWCRWTRRTDLDGHAYRLQTPSDSPVYPAAALNGHTVAVTLRGGGDTALTVLLDRHVPWRLRFNAGATTVRVDLSQAQFVGLDLLQGVSTLDVTCGRPAASVVLRAAAGVSNLALHVPSATPVTVHARGGAGTVTIFERAHHGVPADATFTSGTSGRAGYVIDAQAGVSDITVDTRS